MTSTPVSRASVALLAIGAVLAWSSCGGEGQTGPDSGVGEAADVQALSPDASAAAADVGSIAADAAAPTPDAAAPTPPDAAAAGLDAAQAGLDAALAGADASSIHRDAGPALPYSDAGCLAYAGANQVCGDGSSGTMCAFSVQCGASSSGGQCNINCTMGAGYSRCYGPTDVACVQDAWAASDCAAFKACNWVL
ncbi:MAG TPA: hypothetical protein VGK67_26765 [Myxococcales bacterium]|jgi:hypothetical protein